MEDVENKRLIAILTKENEELLRTMHVIRKTFILESVPEKDKIFKMFNELLIKYKESQQNVIYGGDGADDVQGSLQRLDRDIEDWEKAIKVNCNIL